MALLKQRSFCPGIPDFPCLGDSPTARGTITATDFTAAADDDPDVELWFPELVQQSAKSLKLQAFTGEDGTLRSTLCSGRAAPAGGPCAACRKLRDSSVHQLQRSEASASRRLDDIAAGRTDWRAKNSFELGGMGRRELAVRLQAAVQPAAACDSRSDGSSPEPDGGQLAELVRDAQAAAVVSRLDIIVRDGVYWLYGLCGGEVAVHSVEEACTLVRQRGFAVQLDIFVTAAVTRHGLSLPLLANATNGALKAPDVQSNLVSVLSELGSQGARVMAHVVDGASTNRKVTKDLCLLSRSSVDPKALVLAHWLLECHGPCLQDEPILLFIDPMHTGWRCRLALLRPLKRLMIGPYLVSESLLYSLSKQDRFADIMPRLGTSVLDASNKQNQAGTLM
ncbi:hypothetical protein GPECTOR_1182g444 [Gonium pectorale]|uniref:Uncharacterized protein n=1 Tax=Gonium pectorale TaxID=33097 RepID=A0A150FTJ9_GONPE|nr:hypothetical protein GPECTOR_1182g444 [Gonium pectorale]|eukprot:KXZ40953.1 hypothetical protein GPECTOR_1182g444 [Gonium pectorale]